MNFMKCIGDHMNGSGLHEIWVESDLLGPIATEQKIQNTNDDSLTRYIVGTRT